MAKVGEKVLKGNKDVVALLLASAASAVTLEVLNAFRLASFNQGLDQPYAPLAGWTVSLAMALLAGVPGFLFLRKKVSNAGFVAFFAAMGAFWLGMVISVLVLQMTGWSVWLLASVAAFAISYLTMDQIFNQSSFSRVMKVGVASIAIVATAAIAMAAPYLAN